MRVAVPPFCWVLPAGNHTTLCECISNCIYLFAAANQFFMNEVYDPEHREAPITDLSSASEEVSVIH